MWIAVTIHTFLSRFRLYTDVVCTELYLVQFAGDHNGVVLFEQRTRLLLVVEVALVFVGISVLAAEEVGALALEPRQAYLLSARPTPRSVLLHLAFLLFDRRFRYRDLGRSSWNGDSSSGHRWHRGDNRCGGCCGAGGGLDGSGGRAALRVGPLVFAEALGAHVHGTGRTEKAAVIGAGRGRR